MNVGRTALLFRILLLSGMISPHVYRPMLETGKSPSRGRLRQKSSCLYSLFGEGDGNCGPTPTALSLDCCRSKASNRLRVAGGSAHLHVVVSERLFALYAFWLRCICSELRKNSKAINSNRQLAFEFRRMLLSASASLSRSDAFRCIRRNQCVCT